MAAAGGRCGRAARAGAVLAAVAAALAAGAGPATAGGRAPAASDGGQVLVDERTLPDLAYPEGIAADHGRLYVSTYQVASPGSSRVFVLDAASGRVRSVLGDRPGEEAIAAAPLLGLAVDPGSGALYVAANGSSRLLRVTGADSGSPLVEDWATLPDGAGPEDLTVAPDGALWVTDSNRGAVYRVPARDRLEVVLSAGDGSDPRGLLQAPAAGLSPNGIAVGRDRVYLANTASDTVAVAPLTPDGRLAEPLRVLATNPTDALDVRPYGFEALAGPDTQYGAVADQPLNGPDGLQLDTAGHLWAADVLAGNLTELDAATGRVLRTLGHSAATSDGSLAGPAGIAFAGGRAYVTNLAIFDDGSNPNPRVPFSVVSFRVGRGADSR